MTVSNNAVRNTFKTCFGLRTFEETKFYGREATRSGALAYIAFVFSGPFACKTFSMEAHEDALIKRATQLGFRAELKLTPGAVYSLLADELYRVLDSVVWNDDELVGSLSEEIELLSNMVVARYQVRWDEYRKGVDAESLAAAKASREADAEAARVAAENDKRAKEVNAFYAVIDHPEEFAAIRWSYDTRKTPHLV